MDKKEREQRYREHFRKWGKRDAANNIVQLFSDMSYKQKQEYVTHALYPLHKEYPNDKNIKLLVKIGKRELYYDGEELPYSDKKNWPKSRKSSEKISRYTTTILLSLCLLLSPNSPIVPPKISRISRELRQSK
jgi:hypothetical protein